MSRRHRRIRSVAALICLGVAARAHAQADSVRADPAGAPTTFFSTEVPLAVTLTANFDALRRDRAEDPPWRAGSLAWTDSAGVAHAIALRLRPRGIWRRKNCQMPPLRLDLPRSRIAETPFADLNRPKLVNFCHDSDRGERYILQELQLYRVYRELTPFSHRARLLRIAYADSGSGRIRTTRWAIVIEEPEALARRIGGTAMELNGVEPEWLDPRSRTLVGLFQHLIGNHDWSIGALHNVHVVSRDSVMHPVAYDFDYAGAVDAHYAVPPPQVPIRRVRERHFRGDCAPPEVLREVIDRFVDRRAAILGLYDDDVGRLLPPRVARETVEYLDRFFEEIADPRRVDRAIVRQCRRQ